MGEIVAVVVIYAALMALLLALQLGPDPLLVAAVVLLGHAVLRLVFDAVSEPSSSWAVKGSYAEPEPGRDHAFSDMVRVIEDQLSARTPTSGLQSRLAMAADEALRRRHRAPLSDPQARELLGPELGSALAGPPRRLALGELDTFVTRIEEL